jgi:hypothetical protein
MRFTENYRLGSVLPSEPLNPVEDSRRMQTIDRQLLGMFEIFGNGIIEGWELKQSTGLTVSVTPGRGHISFASAETPISGIVTLEPNSTNWVYAKLTEDGKYTRNVSFFARSAPLTSGVDAVFLGMVGTNLNTVRTIDVSGRNDISFIETIKKYIIQHKHRGGTDNPSRVSLVSEVMGKLPGYRVDNLDASNVTTGRIPAARMPAIEHGDLLHSGILTHAQLDSFVRDLSNPNTRLLGELSTTNLLQLYLAHKHIWSEVDKYATNMLVMIPGITDDTFTDYTNTTALVDRYNHTIQGIPAPAGRLHTITFSTESDFTNAFARVNLNILTDQTGSRIKLTQPLSELIVDDFDNVFSDNTEIPGWVVETTPSVTVPDNTSFKTDSYKKQAGTYSAKFHIEQEITVQVTKDYGDSPADWTGYNIVQVSVETLTLSHGQVRMQILGPEQSGVYQIIDDFMLLNINETTKGFKTVARDISNLTRDKIQAVRIYTDTSLGWTPSDIINVNIDTIKALNTIYYDPAGFVRFRLQTPQKSRWAAISWDGDNNDGQISARARTASSYSVFDQTLSSTYGPSITTPGDDPQVADNTSMEVEVALASNEAKTSSPTLRSITISYITHSEDRGIVIDSVPDFMRGLQLLNTTVVSYPGEYDDDGEEQGSVVINGRNDTGDVVYGLINSAQQSTFAVNQIPVMGITGNDLFVSPWQAVTNDLMQLYIRRKTGLDGVAHVQRQDDRTYLISDTFNDRVLLISKDGLLLSGLVTNNVRNQTELYPIVAIYNKRLNGLYVAWSKNIELTSQLDLSKFHINSAGLSMNLSNQTEKASSISGLPGDSGKASGNVTFIELSTAHNGEISSYLESQGADAQLYLDIDADAVPDGLDKTNANYASLSSPRGLPMPSADVLFVPGIYRPISVTISQYTGNWIVCNAKPLDTSDPVTGVSKTEVTSVIEYDPTTGEVVFSDDSLDFSIITLGGVAEFNEKYLAIAGISSEPYPPPTSTSTSSTRQTLGIGTVSVSATTTTTQTQTEATTGTQTSVESTITTDFSKLASYRGRVRLVEKASGRVVFDQLTSDGTFAADVQVDGNDNMVVIEKYYVNATNSPLPYGRGRVIKMDEDGNIYWQYGLGAFESFNDVRTLSNGNVIICS